MRGELVQMEFCWGGGWGGCDPSASSRAPATAKGRLELVAWGSWCSPTVGRPREGLAVPLPSRSHPTPGPSCPSCPAATILRAPCVCDVSLLMHPLPATGHLVRFMLL